MAEYIKKKFLIQTKCKCCADVKVHEHEIIEEVGKDWTEFAISTFLERSPLYENHKLFTSYCLPCNINTVQDILGYSAYEVKTTTITELIEQEAEKLNKEIIERDKTTTKEFAEKIIQYSREQIPPISNS